MEKIQVKVTTNLAGKNMKSPPVRHFAMFDGLLICSYYAGKLSKKLFPLYVYGAC